MNLKEIKEKYLGSSEGMEEMMQLYCNLIKQNKDENHNPFLQSMP